MSKYLTIILISIFTLSCSKDESEEVDLKNTQISITKPTENLIVSKGDTLRIEAIITSDVSMHGYEIIIHDLATKTQQSIIDKHTHGKKLSITQSWITSNETLGEKEIEVVAIIEHTGLKTSAKRKLVIQ
ncbi:MAG TPA: hypothetical protein VK169_20610 [Saprospiraceae bacterium]|nr:hypothetical protein [Saprospiraceae bacterium]